MRIGIRSAISGLVLTSIVVSAVGVHLLWWRTAQQVSQTLADTINDQIVSAVGDELQSITTEARSSMMAVRTLLVEKVFESRDAEQARVRVPVATAGRSRPFPGWRSAGRTARSLPGTSSAMACIEMIEIGRRPQDQDQSLRICRRRSRLKDSRVEDTKYSVTDQEWFREAIAPTTSTGRR